MLTNCSIIRQVLKGCSTSLSYKFKYSTEVVNSSVYVSTCQSIFYNLALEDWIYNHVEFNKRVMLLIWRNNPCVVVGRHQNPWAECNINEAANQHIEIARRKSGGGTVYHDLGNVNVTFFTSRKKYNRKENLTLVADTMNGFGLNVEINERDDLVRDGMKISGTAAKLGRNVAYHHCTLLLDVDMSQLKSVLLPTVAGIDSKATESVKSPCLNLNDVNPQLSYSDMVDAISSDYLAKYSNSESSFQYVDPTNGKHFQGLFECYQELTSWEWMYAKTPKFTIRRCFQFEDSNDDAARVEVLLQIQKGVIDNVDVIIGSSAATTEGATVLSGDDGGTVLGACVDLVSAQLLGTRFWPSDVRRSLARVGVTKEDLYLPWLLSCVGEMCSVGPRDMY